MALYPRLMGSKQRIQNKKNRPEFGGPVRSAGCTLYALHSKVHWSSGNSHRRQGSIYPWYTMEGEFVAWHEVCNLFVSAMKVITTSGGTQWSGMSAAPTCSHTLCWQCVALVMSACVSADLHALARSTCSSNTVP